MFCPAALQPLHSDLIFDSGDNNLSISGIFGFVYRQQILIEYAYIAHAVASDPQQIVCPGMEKFRRYSAMFLNMLRGQNGFACSHLTDNGEARVFWQSDTATGAWNDLNRAFACQCLKMLFCCVGAFKTELCGNVGTGWWVASGRDMFSNQIKNLRLPCGKLLHVF